MCYNYVLSWKEFPTFHVTKLEEFRKLSPRKPKSAPSAQRAGTALYFMQALTASPSQPCDADNPKEADFQRPKNHRPDTEYENVRTEQKSPRVKAVSQLEKRDVPTASFGDPRTGDPAGASTHHEAIDTVNSKVNDPVHLKVNAKVNDTASVNVVGKVNERIEVKVGGTPVGKVEDAEVSGENWHDVVVSPCIWTQTLKDNVTRLTNKILGFAH